MIVRYSRRAREDLLDIWLRIARDDVTAADRLYERLEARVKILAEFAEAGPLRPGIASDARMLVEGNYLIFYRIRSEDVQIVRVLHGAREIQHAMFTEGRDDAAH